MSKGGEKHSEPGRAPQPERLRAAANTGVLSGIEIAQLNLVRCQQGVTIKAASCDLHIGNEVFYCGTDRPVVTHVPDGTPITLESFATAIVSTREVIATPRDVVGRFDLKIKKGLQGLLLQVGPQVEPAYEGPLFGMLLNTTGEPKSFFPGDVFLVIEFAHVAVDPERCTYKRVLSLAEFLVSQKIDLQTLAQPSEVQRLRQDVRDLTVQLEKCLQAIGDESAKLESLRNDVNNITRVDGMVQDRRQVVLSRRNLVAAIVVPSAIALGSLAYTCYSASRAQRASLSQPQQNGAQAIPPHAAPDTSRSPARPAPVGKRSS